uniref:ASCH domain-containing protein n=1 Tax=Candidatus Enterococcus willemsii TaxID=1857215 RepID=UPI00403FB22B
MNTIKTYWENYATKHNLPLTLPDYWMFGDGSEAMGNKLGELVIRGIKTGTCAAHCTYELENEPIQQVGQYDIVLDGSNQPLAIIQYTKIEILPMNEVSEEFAISEGEGDLTYDYWYREHEKFFRWELEQYGLAFTPEMLLVCQSFKVVDVYSQASS